MTSSIDATKPIEGSATTASVRANFATAAAEISALQITGNEWIDPVTAAYASTTTFTVTGDYTATFYPNSIPGKRIKCTGGSDVYAYVLSATYSAPSTTVTVPADVTLNAGMTTVYISIQNIDSTYAINPRYYKVLSTETAANIYNYDYSWENVLRYIPRSYHSTILDKSNTTDLHTYIQNHLNEHLETYFPQGSYRITTGLTATSGAHIYGAGKYNTFIENDSNTYAFTYTNCQFCLTENMNIGAIGTDGADLGILVAQSTTGNSLSNTFRGIRFDGNTRAAVATTTQIAMYFSGAAVGYANYFNVIDDCNFVSWNTCIKADWNANAGLMTNCQFQNLWYGITGGMQEWKGVNLWWHSTAGSGADYATFIYLVGASGTNKSQYNAFDFTAEPGTTLTHLYYFDTNTLANYLRGHWQVTAEGTDSGTYNHRDHVIARTLTLQDYSINNIQAINDENSNTADANNLGIFGDGTNAQAGTGQQKVKIFGYSAGTRHMQLYQTAGDCYVSANVAGKIQVRGSGSGSGVIVGDGAWNGEPMQLGSYYLWVDATGALRIKSSAPASDLDGTVVGTQT